jgi:hypothetical protein
MLGRNAPLNARAICAFAHYAFLLPFQMGRINKTRLDKNPGAGYFVLVPMPSVSPYLNPQYYSGIATYEDGRMAIFYRNFA